MRVLVTGSRQASDQTPIYRELDALWERWWPNATHPDEFMVIHGGAPGADTLAGQWCHDRRDRPGIAQEVHPAQWGLYGSHAGGIRNQIMVNAGADIVLAFFRTGAKNAGTRNCVTTARLAGLDVQEFWVDA